MASYDGQDLGVVLSEQFTKAAGITTFQGVLEDSDLNTLLQEVSSLLKIKVNGVFTGTEDEVRVFARFLDDKVDGKQVTTTVNPKIYSSDLMGKTYLTVITNVNWSWNQGVVREVQYTLELLEGQRG